MIMKNRILLLLCCLFVGLQAYAQVSVAGKVVDADGFELPGVNVSVQGTHVGTLTDVDGAFSIPNVPGGENAELVFSFVGFKPQVVKIGNKKFLDIRMLEDSEQIDEVVVIAYGTAKKKDLTGSMSAIDSRVIGVQNTTSASKALEGQVPGLQISTVDGQPGLDAAIRVRGVGSANLNSSGALVVIDGVPAQTENPLSNINQQDIQSITVLKDAASTAMYGSRGANGVVLITTKSGAKGKTRISFESRWGFNQAGPFNIDKIRDSDEFYEYAWQSIYNSARYGVNGSGLPQNFQTNVQNPNMSHDEAAQFASAHLFDYSNSMTKFQRNALGNWMHYDVPGAIYTPTGSGTNGSSTMSGAYLVNPDGKMNPNARRLYGGNEYEDELLKTRFRQEYNLSANGGSENVDYFISLGMLDNPSYISNSEFKRYSGRSNVNAKLYSWLKVGANVGYVHTNTRSMATKWGTGRNAGSNAGNLFRTINGQNPLKNLYARDADGNIILNPDGSKKVHVKPGDTYSPLGPTVGMLYDMDIIQAMDQDITSVTMNNWTARTYADVTFLKDFNFRVNFSMDNSNRILTKYRNGETGVGAGIGGMSKVATNYMILNTQELLTYNKDFNKVHHVDALIGHEYNDYQDENVNWGGGYELIPGFISSSNFVGKYSNVGGLDNPGYGKNTVRMESYMARANYIYDDRYYLSASVRRDGSSKFKYAKDRWGTFWSVGGAWRVTGEKFMESTQEWLDNLKLRASYGVIGNQNGIGNYSGYRTWSYGAKYVSTTSGTGTPDTYTLSVGGFVNDRLTWENTKTFDVGMDFTIFGRTYVTLDYYNRLTDNSFWNCPVSYLATGQSSIQQNSASIRNRGIEVEISTDIIRGKDFTWNVSLNGTHYTNVLDKIPAGSVNLDENGCFEANIEGWSASGTSDASFVAYYRGEGKDFYNMYMYKYAGVEQSSGLPMFYHRVTEADVANNTYPGYKKGESVAVTNYNLADRYEMGSALPKWIGGFTTTFNYKGFDLTAMLSYQLGGKFYSVEYGNGLYISENHGNSVLARDLVGNTWTPENTNAKYPMQWYGTSSSYTNGSTFGSWKYTDMALFNASYLKMRNITLGYTLPSMLVSKYGISNLRFFASADNLFMISAAKGVDPNMSLTGGLDVGAFTYPDMRTFTFGLNLSF